MTPDGRRQEAGPHLFVLGNEKGGSGKSTTAMHLVVALLYRGLSVGVIDLDARQGSLSRYVENRAALVQREGMTLPVPPNLRIHRSTAESRTHAESEERQAFLAAVADFAALDCIVVDTPGSDSFLSRLGHSHADTLITPLNDSLLDLDLLAQVDAEGLRIVAPSVYSQMVWEQRQQRAKAGRRPIDWVVMRNRLSHIDARNKRDIGRLLEQLARRIGFRTAPGFGERVIFRELFAKGLTLLDLREEAAGVALSVSHLAARQEVRSLLRAIGLPDAANADRISRERRAAAGAGSG